MKIILAKWTKKFLLHPDPDLVAESACLRDSPDAFLQAFTTLNAERIEVEVGCGLRRGIFFGIKSNDRNKKKPVGNEKYTANTSHLQYYRTEAHKLQHNTQKLIILNFR